MLLLMPKCVAETSDMSPYDLVPIPSGYIVIINVFISLCEHSCALTLIPQTSFPLRLQKHN